jgi:hypothetical protein
MPRQIVSTVELRALIQERISNSFELDGDCRGVIVNSVYWHEPDETGTNWDVHSFRNVTGCEGVVRAIVAEFKKKYNVHDK